MNYDAEALGILWGPYPGQNAVHLRYYQIHGGWH